MSDGVAAGGEFQDRTAQLSDPPLSGQVVESYVFVKQGWTKDIQFKPCPTSFMGLMETKLKDSSGALVAGMAHLLEEGAITSHHYFLIPEN